LSAISWQTLAISVRTSNTTRSIARRVIATRRASRRQAGQGGQGDTGNTVDQFVDILPAQQLLLLLGDAESEQFVLSPVENQRLPHCWRLFFLASLNHAIGFELADVRAAAIAVQRQCRRADGRGLSDRGRGIGLAMGATVSVISVVRVASRHDSLHPRSEASRMPGRAAANSVGREQPSGPQA